MTSLDTKALSSALENAGFDLFTPFNSKWYNDYIASMNLATDEDHVGGMVFSLQPLPLFGHPAGSLSFLIGNSRVLWLKLLAWLRDHTGLEDPVDAYCEEVISKAVAAVAGDIKYDIFWAADMSPSRLVDMNRASLVSGSTYFSEEMFLSIHPKYGSWIAFRAVITFDVPASTALGEPPARLPPLLSADEEAAARVAFAEAMEASSKVDMTLKGMPPDIAHKWAAMRDCVSLGREFKYSALQSEYHYTKDPSLIQRALTQLENA